MIEVAVLLFIVILMEWFLGKNFVFYFLLLVAFSTLILNVSEIQKLLGGNKE